MKRNLILAGIALAIVAGWSFGIAFSRTVMVGSNHGLPCDLYPLWNGVHFMLHGGDPYSAALTHQNNVFIHGSGSGVDELFAYPLFASLAVLPLEFTSFAIASKLAFVLYAALVMLSVVWFRGKWDSTTLCYSLLALASYPVIFGLQTLQPVILYFALALASYAALRARNRVLAALLGALAAGKPHVTLPILLPMFLWSLRNDRRFSVWFSGSLALVTAALLLVNPHWISEWLSALGTRSRQMEPSLLVNIFGKPGVMFAGVALMVLLPYLWFSSAKLPAKVSVSVMVFLLVMPWQFYNSVVLVVPILWVLDNASESVSAAVLRVSLAAYWLGTGIAFLLIPSNLAWALPSIMLGPVMLALLLAPLHGCITHSGAPDGVIAPALGLNPVSEIPQIPEVLFASAKDAV